uniref:Kinetochore-associated protein 1 n=1 Tax=Syphacia muris TaxID=451379 RepID=A0A0N5A7V4_9BILA
MKDNDSCVLTVEVQKDPVIVSIEWYTNVTVETSSIVQTSNKLESTRITHEYQINENRPRLLIAYKYGILQLMRNDNDSFPITVKINNLTTTDAAWAPNGRYIAVCGVETVIDTCRNTVHLLSVYGEQLRKLYLPGESVNDLSWDSTGTRLCIAIDTNIYFAYIRYKYKWAYCGQTVVYGYEPNDGLRQCVVFFETVLEECYLKVSEYYLQICNGIATPLNSKVSEIEPKYISMNGAVIVVASDEAFFVWNYSISDDKESNSLTLEPVSSDLMYFAENIKYSGRKVEAGKKGQIDPFCAVAVADEFFLICRESGVAHRFSLPNKTLDVTFSLGVKPERLQLNCNFSKLAVLCSTGLKLFRLNDAEAVPLSFERKDVWDFCWNSENEDTIAIAEKTKIYILKDMKVEEPVISNGYICSFENLLIRTVNLDEIMRNPEMPNKNCITVIEDKSLRDVKKMLEEGSVKEVTEYIEKNGHPKLWSLLAEMALKRLDTATAEHAFVMLKDYSGIQLIKRISSLQSTEMKKAEVALFYGRLDEAEKIYVESGRKDLAVAMRAKFNDWFRILDGCAKLHGLYCDDVLKQKANQEIGNYYLERQCWAKAMNYFEKADCYEEMMRCALMSEDYDKLNAIAKQLPDGHSLLSKLGDLFGGVGLCEEAVDCYLRCDKVNLALDICVQLNQWEKAVQLSKDHKLKDIDLLLKKYTNELKNQNSDKTLAVVQLYRRSGRYIEAARIVSEIADEERKGPALPLRLKKLYVLSGLLIEQYHQQHRNKLANSEDNNKVQITLKGLLEEDTVLSASDSILIDNAWRGAEAYHFCMLAHRQFYNKHLESALKTAVRLTDYEDFIDPLEIYSLLALISCAARQFYICSRAFMKLESLSTLSGTEKQCYSKLAISIFKRHPPEDENKNYVECPFCKEKIQDYCSSCPQCNTNFPVCVITGRPLLDYQFWTCPACKHRASEVEIKANRVCALCHYNLINEQN